MRKSEGIVLKSTLYEEEHRVLALFTEANGLVRLFVRRAERSRYWSPESLAAFTRLSVVYGARREETLPRLRDAKVIDQYLALRTRLNRIEAAGAMGRTLLASQLPGKPAPKLYQLLVRYLDTLGTSDQTDSLWASFHLKFLLHEGLLPLRSRCSRCDINLAGAGLAEGETLCLQHAPPNALFLEPQELETMMLLAGSRKLSEVLATKVSSEVKWKIQQLLESSVE